MNKNAWEDESLSSQERIMALLAHIGELYMDDHVVLKSDKHSSAYVNHRTLVKPEHAAAFRILTRLMAQLLKGIDLPIDALVGPETFGWPLCHWSVYEHNLVNPNRQLMSVPALKRKKGESGDPFTIPEPFRSKLKGTRCLVIDDVLTTSATAHELIPTIEAAGGRCDGLVASCDRSGKSAGELGLRGVWSLFAIDAPIWDAAECPLCKSGKRVNTVIGHGAEFMLSLVEPKP